MQRPHHQRCVQGNRMRLMPKLQTKAASRTTRRRIVAALPLLPLALSGRAWAAPDYPTRPVSVVVPYAAGGGLDLMARLLAQKLTERAGQSFFVENRLRARGRLCTRPLA